jgi:hypothetical protein
MKCYGCKAEGTVPQWIGEQGSLPTRRVLWCEECAKRIIDRYMEGKW